MPYIASMGIYVAKADKLKELLSNDMPTVRIVNVLLSMTKVILITYIVIKYT